MPDEDYIIRLDLHEFFADDRKRSRILIHKNYKRILDLEKRISEIFEIKEFHLLSDGHLLPSCEDIALVKSGETVSVRPNTTSSPLLSEVYYTDHSNALCEKYISKDEISLNLIQQDSNNFEKNSEGSIVSVPKKKKVKRNNDHTEHSLLPKEDGCQIYASTPNRSNISPDQSNDKRKNKLKKEMIESDATKSHEKKKRKHKSEKNDSLEQSIDTTEQRNSKKRKHIVVNIENESDIAYNKNSSEFECEASQAISHIEKNNTSITEIMQNEKEISQKQVKDSHKKNKKLKKISSSVEDLKSSNSCSGEAPPENTNSEKLEEKIVSHISKKSELHSRPLPYKKARDCKSWSVAPLPKTTNLVKIIKVPIARIDSDSSNNASVDVLTSDTTLDNSKRNLNKTQNNSDPSQNKGQQKEMIQGNIKWTQFKNSSVVSQDNLPQVETTKSMSIESSPTPRNKIIEDSNEMIPQLISKELSNSPDRTDNTLKFTSDKQSNCNTGESEEVEDDSSSKVSTTRTPPENLQTELSENNSESQMTVTNEDPSQSLEEERNSISWSTAPLPKKTNLVKIVKVPIAIIEIDYSRFLYDPDKAPSLGANIENLKKDSSNNISNTFEAITVNASKAQKNPDASNQKKQKMEFLNYFGISKQKSDPIISQNSLEKHNRNMNESENLSVISEANSHQLKSQNSFDEKQNHSQLLETVSVENSSNCEDKKSKAPTANHKFAHFAITSKNEYSQFESGKEERNIETPSKREARELWKQKINQKYIQNFDICDTKSSNSSVDSPAEKKINFCDKNRNVSSVSNYSANKTVKDELKIERSQSMKEVALDDSKGSDVEFSEPYDETLEESQLINKSTEISNDSEAPIGSFIEDSSFSNTTETVTDGNIPEPKRKRRRRHRKKTTKNEIHTQRPTRESVNRYTHSKDSILTSAKPKIHLRFKDSDDDLPVQNENPNEIEHGSQVPVVEEKIKILQDVSLNTEKNSLNQTEFLHNNHDENEGNIESSDVKVPSSSNLESGLCNKNNGQLQKLKAELLKTIDALESSLNCSQVEVGSIP